MPLINMKIEKKQDNTLCCDDDGFGYGLDIYLDDERLKKLGFTEPLEVGAVVTIQAKAVVESSSKNADKDGKKISSSLQITDMSVETGGKDTAEILFGKEGD